MTPGLTLIQRPILSHRPAAPCRTALDPPLGASSAPKPNLAGLSSPPLAPPQASPGSAPRPSTPPRTSALHYRLLRLRDAGSKGRVRKPEALTPHRVLGQVWGVESAVAGWGLTSETEVEASSLGSAVSGGCDPPNGEQGPQALLTWAPVWLEVGEGTEASRLSLLPLQQLNPPTPGTAPRQALTPQGAPAGGPGRWPLRWLNGHPCPLPAWNRVCTICSSSGNGHCLSCLLGYGRRIPEAPHFPGQLKSHSIRNHAPKLNCIFLF